MPLSNKCRLRLHARRKRVPLGAMRSSPLGLAPGQAPCGRRMEEPHPMAVGWAGPLSPRQPCRPGLPTWEHCGLFQLTGTRTLELEPDEVEDVLRVTATARGFPSGPEEPCSSS